MSSEKNLIIKNNEENLTIENEENLIIEKFKEEPLVIEKNNETENTADDTLTILVEMEKLQEEISYIKEEVMSIRLMLSYLISHSRKY